MSLPRGTPRLPEGDEPPPARPPGAIGAAPWVQRRWPRVLGLVLVAGIAYWLYVRPANRAPTGGQGALPRQGQPVPVQVASARAGDMPVYLTGLGSVTAFNTVTVKSRVDGQLVNVAFHEGQPVHEGDLLAEVDPRPFEVQVTQAEGQMARDQAQLEDARRGLVRFRTLRAQGVISQQDLDDQQAKFGQFAGAIKADQGAIDGARLQLAYSRITAPISGRAGLRQVDVGNMIHASDQNGLVVITQMQPVAVLFTIPEDALPPVTRKLAAGEVLEVEAYDRADQNRIATGQLLTTDNQIDQSTGTIRLKATFPNDDGVLFPNQFVNVHLLLEVRRGAVIVPIAAIQRGPQGTFVYVVQPDDTVAVRPLSLGATWRAEAAVDKGLSPDEVVVVDGVDKLREGSKVQARQSDRDAPAPPLRP